MPNSLASLRGEVGALQLPAVRQAVVVLIDGLGALQLRQRLGHARHTVAGWAKKDTAFSFPSTTVAGITSLTTGTSAGEHGLVAYTAFDRATGAIRNQISGWGDDMRPDAWQSQPTVFERMRVTDPGIRPVVVGLPEYETSGLTEASLRGADYVKGESIADRVEAALDVLATGERCLVYLYIAELDQAGHKFGWQSDEWIARLEEADSAISTLIGQARPGTGILVTADHGMIDIAPEQQLEVPLDSPLLEGVIAVAGEPRLRHLFTGDNSLASATELATRWRVAEGSRAVVLTRDEAIDAGWYGNSVSAAVRERIGNVIVAAQKQVTYFTEDMTGHGRLVIGQHGSITPEETLVPLIRHGAYARR